MDKGLAPTTGLNASIRPGYIGDEVSSQDISVKFRKLSLVSSHALFFASL